MADHIRRVLVGDVNNLPQKESNIIRIFTSSTFTGNLLNQRPIEPMSIEWADRSGVGVEVVFGN